MCTDHFQSHSPYPNSELFQGIFQRTGFSLPFSDWVAPHPKNQALSPNAPRHDAVEASPLVVAFVIWAATSFFVGLFTGDARNPYPAIPSQGKGIPFVVVVL